jgi:hypothetical protein
MNARRRFLVPLALVFVSLPPDQFLAAQPVQVLPGPAVPGLQPEPQRAYGPSSDTLIARQTADGILEGFRKVYKTDHAPRIVIYVNRALVDTAGGFKVTHPTETHEKTDLATKSSGTNTYAVQEAGTPTLADQQTVREVERLFGRAFRHAGPSSPIRRSRRRSCRISPANLCRATGRLGIARRWRKLPTSQSRS